MAGPQATTEAGAAAAWDALPRQEGGHAVQQVVHYAARAERNLTRSFGGSLIGHDIPTAMAVSQLRAALVELEATKGGSSA